MKGENPEFLFRFTDEKKLRIALKNNQKKFVCSAQLFQICKISFFKKQKFLWLFLQAKLYTESWALFFQKEIFALKKVF